MTRRSQASPGSEMEFLQPSTWPEALAMKAAHPEAVPIAGGTDVMVELASTTGSRRLPAREFYTGPKRNAMRGDELIAAFLVEPAKGPQQFSKVGTRNAMVIAVCSFALALDPERRQVGTGIGSAAPTPVSAGEAESFMEGVLDEAGLWETPGELDASAMKRFGELVAAAARPIDDVRGTAAYRRHALSVLARRTFTWAWDEYRRTAP